MAQSTPSHAKTAATQRAGSWIRGRLRLALPCKNVLIRQVNGLGVCGSTTAGRVRLLVGHRQLTPGVGELAEWGRRRAFSASTPLRSSAATSTIVAGRAGIHHSAAALRALLGNNGSTINQVRNALSVQHVMSRHHPWSPSPPCDGTEIVRNKLRPPASAQPKPEVHIDELVDIGDCENHRRQRELPPKHITAVGSPINFPSRRAIPSQDSSDGPWLRSQLAETGMDPAVPFLP